MIKQVAHVAAGCGAADLGLALDVAYALHPPVRRAPEVAGRPVKGRPATPRGRRSRVRR